MRVNASLFLWHNDSYKFVTTICLPVKRHLKLRKQLKMEHSYHVIHSYVVTRQQWLPKLAINGEIVGVYGNQLLAGACKSPGVRVFEEQSPRQGWNSGNASCSKTHSSPNGNQKMDNVIRITKAPSLPTITALTSDIKFK